jgi:endothelin-converting enzyme/putative endopeptidase
MRTPRILAALPALLVAVACAGQGHTPDPAATVPTVTMPPPDGGAPLDATPDATAAIAPPTETPLTALPYTPSLDRDAMDATADPCVSLYQYACGNWMKKNPIPPDQSSWSVYGKLTNDNRRYLWGILTDLQSADPKRTPAQQKIGDYFAACMDEGAIEKRGASPLAADLAAIDALASLRDLAPLVATLQIADGGDSGYLFGFSAQQDFENSALMVADAGAGGLGLPDRDFYTKTDARSVELRTKYVAHVARMLALLGDPRDVAEREAAQIMALETRLAEASLTRTDKRDPRKLFHRTTSTKLAQDVPDFDWKRYFAALGTTELASLNVEEPAFLARVQLLLKTVPLSDWKPYLRWHVVHARARYLSKAFVDENFDFFSHTLRGVSEQKPRWKRCVALVDEQLGEALGQEFVRRTFAEQTRARVLEMTQRIEKAMEGVIQSEAWMGPGTKREALAKLHAMVNKIGFPEKFRDYGTVTIARDDFAGNAQRASAFEAKRWLAKVGKPVDRSEWFMTPPTVNAYYDPQMNDMNFPSGVLQPPLYDPKLDDAPNYGNTGATIGHELTHGFDDSGRHFDAKGNLRDWWTKTDATAFEARAKCVADQYSTYTIVDDVKINGEMTNGEDIADLGGTMLALLAWRESQKGKPNTPIDGLTPDQRFWVGMAQWTCENQRPENLRADALTNVHSPGRYRIDGVAANLVDFEKAFSCKPGQPMAPAKRCKVW